MVPLHAQSKHHRIEIFILAFLTNDEILYAQYSGDETKHTKRQLNYVNKNWKTF